VTSFSNLLNLFPIKSLNQAGALDFGVFLPPSPPVPPLDLTFLKSKTSPISFLSFLVFITSYLKNFWFLVHFLYCIFCVNIDFEYKVIQLKLKMNFNYLSIITFYWIIVHYNITNIFDLWKTYFINKSDLSTIFNIII